MLGYVIWHPQERFSPKMERRVMAQVPFVTLLASPPRPLFGKRRLLRAGELLKHHGVHQVAVRGEPPTEMLEWLGVQEVECAPLRMANLEQLMTFAAERTDLCLRRSCVLVRAAQVDGQVVRAARAAARCARRVALDVGRGQEALAQLLRREYGLAEGGSPEMQLCVSRPEEEGLPVIHIGSGCRRRQKIVWECAALPEADESLLAAIFQTKKEEMRDLRIKSVEFLA